MARLSDYSRDHIRQAVQSILDRLSYFPEFPYDTRDQEFMDSFYDPRLMGHIRELRRLGFTGAISTTWNKTIDVLAAEDGERVGKLEINTHDWVSSDTALKPSNPMYSAILKWMEENVEHRVKYHESMGYFRDVLDDCNTAGQLNRLFPFLAGHMPDGLQDELKNAKRMSRLPWEINEEEVLAFRDTFHDTLALASLLPEVPEYNKRTSFPEPTLSSKYYKNKNPDNNH